MGKYRLKIVLMDDNTEVIYADINNVPESLDFLVKNGFARKTPMSRQSGFVTYPAVAVDLLKMCAIAPEKFEEMTSLLPDLECYTEDND